MKSFAFLLILILSFMSLTLAQPDPETMRAYYVAFLKKGPNWTAEQTPELLELQQKHLAHISYMAETGKVLLAGPFIDAGEMRGMLVFKTESLDEAWKLANEDPAVKAGRLVAQFVQWYSAKGININPDLD